MYISWALSQPQMLRRSTTYPCYGCGIQIFCLSNEKYGHWFLSMELNLLGEMYPFNTHTEVRYGCGCFSGGEEKAKKKKQNTNLMLMDWYLIPFEWMFLLCGLMIAFSFALFVAIGNFCYLNAGLSKLYSDRSRAFVQRRHCPNLRNKFCHVHPMRQNAR